MSDPTPAEPLATVIERSGIPYPNGQPYTHITAAVVAWNEEERLAPLLLYLSPRFEHLAVAVQESTDRTAQIAQEWATELVYDKHRGYGDATFGPLLLPQVKTKWTLKIDCDEWPSEDLLDSLSSATWAAEHSDANAVWIPFQSSVEGGAYNEQHAHLRLFETRLGWPHTLHSRPMTDAGILWQTGHIRHDRTLDELVQDYLRYWHIGQGRQMWEDHNRMMIRSACVGTADLKGWAFVQSFPWWPEVEAIAFADEKPWLVTGHRKK